MHFILGLFLAAHASVSDVDACNLLREKIKRECLAKSCQGLLGTGTEARIKVRDGKKCEGECDTVSLLSTQNNDLCAAPLPPPRPKTSAPQNNPASHTAGQAGAQKKAVSQVSKAENEIKAKQAQGAEAGQFGRTLQKEKIQSSDELLRLWDQELSSGKSRAFPKDRAKWKNDKALVEEAESAREKNQLFSAEKANQASLPAIRGNLNLFSRAQQLESDATKNLNALATTLTQLVEMKKTGQANLKALDQSSASPVLLGAFAPTNKKILQGLASSAIEGSAKSESAITPEKAGSDSPAPSLSAVGTASPHATHESLRARLRELLQKKMAAEGLSEMPEQFLGELGLPLDLPPDALSAEEVADPETKEEIFRLAGADTDTEIQRLKAQLQDELARSVGVLPEESVSLFERVKAAHLACAIRKCVNWPLKLLTRRAADFYCGS